MGKTMFKIGDRVWHKTKASWARVISLSGLGYYVEHSGWTWSVPAESLESKKARNRALRKSKSYKAKISKNSPGLNKNKGNVPL